MTHAELQELIPAYSLDALSPEEAREVEAHLPACDECQRGLALLRDATVALATGVARVEPPAELRERVLAAVRPRGAGTARAPAGARAPVAAFLARLPVRPLALAAVFLIVVLGGISLSMYQRVTMLKARLTADQQVLELMSKPSARMVPMKGAVSADVRFVYDADSGRGALVAMNLQDPGRELVYQLWMLEGGGPTSAGVFRPEAGGPTVVPVLADFRHAMAVAITVERGPTGAPQPTRAPILVGQIAETGRLPLGLTATAPR